MSEPFTASAISRLDGSDHDGIHLLWTAPPAVGYSLDGFDIQRRKATRDEKVSCHVLTDGELQTLFRELRVAIPPGLVTLQQARCPTLPSKPPDEPAPDVDQPRDADPSAGVPSRFDVAAPDGPAVRASRPPIGIASGLTTQPRCACYELRFAEAHAVVRVTIGVPSVLAIAFRDGKAVGTAFATAATGQQTVVFSGRAVDRVRLYAGRASSLTVCVDQRPTPEQEDRSWATATTIATRIHLPIRAVNGALSSAADEEALAASRLLPGETFDPSAFREAADVMNGAATDAAHVSPMRSTLVTRERAEDPPVELRGWPYALSLLTEAAWRRMLGFGFRDKDVEPGVVYDYRIIGRFRRRDLDETLYGFHTVPVGTTLPRRFHLGPLRVDTGRPTTVQLVPAAPADDLESVGLKGITLRTSALIGPRVTLAWPHPVTRVVLEFEPSPSHDLSYSARTTGFLTGLPDATFSGVVPNARRVEITFAQPVDTVSLKGTAVLIGIRVPREPVAGAPDDVVSRAVVVRDVRFEPTPTPPAPPFLGTRHLQRPPVVGDATTAPDPPRDLGFELSWLPPASATAPLVPWPDDLGAFPPFDVASFVLERRRVDTGGSFEPLDKNTLFFGSRGSRRDTPPLQPGIDLLDAFPEVAAPEPPVPIFMRTEDVLSSPAHAGPPPGSLHQYRIASVDAIGRRSTAPTVGSIVRLEKHTPPPQPVGPTTPVPAGAIRPAGVRVRVLQALDADLTPDDRALLGSSINAIVLEWAWTDRERSRDPWAREFRVYWQPVPPDVIRGTLVGPAVVVGTQFEMTAHVEPPVAADLLRDRYVDAGPHVFRIAGHTAGSTVQVRLHRSAIDPSRVPGPGSFALPVNVSGGDLRPVAWPERTAVVPITAEENYTFVFRDRLTIDVDHPQVRAWVGVSTADDQAYVADEWPGAPPGAARAGNESSLVAVAAEARYLGQPVFVVPPPLPDVPEQVTDEPVAGSVTVTLDLPALLAGVPLAPGQRLRLERLAADALIARMSARDDDTIGARLPDGTQATYTLANPSDHEALLAQIRSAEPRRVEGRFVMDFLTRHATALDPLWQGAVPDRATFGAATDTLPDKAERYLHRVRVVDAAGHVSAGAAILPQFVRVVSLRSPTTPEFELIGSTGDSVTLRARVHDAIDLRWLLVFPLIADVTAPADGLADAKPQLLRLPNRRDLYPHGGIALRLEDGRLVSPTVVDVTTAPLEVPDRRVTTSLTVGFGKRVSIWTVALTSDGIPSRVSGPRTAFTAFAPQPT